MANRKSKRKKNKAPSKSSVENRFVEANDLIIPNDKTFVLEVFEVQVYGGQYLTAANYLLRILSNFDQFRIVPIEGESPNQLTERIKRWCTRLVNACCALFVSPKWKISDPMYFYLCRFHDWLAKIYELSHLENSNFVLDLVNTTQYPSEEQQLKRFYLHLNLNAPQELFQSLLINRDLAFPVLLSMVGDSCTLSVKQEENRGLLIENFPALCEGVTLNNEFVGALHKPWMFCSYAVSDHRHLVKLETNKLIKQLFASISPVSRKTRSTVKPKLAVLIEVCRSDHAMYRCYGPLLRSLKSCFEVTFYATRGSIDEPVAKLADNCEYIDYQAQSMQKVAESIQQQDFDMIYYPSLGMAVWTIFMANLRLAPVQCYSLGHPATSCSQEIDFALCDKDVISDPLCFTEKLVTTKGQSALMKHPAVFEAQKKPDDQIVRIAIVSKYMKLNSLLLNVCAGLTKQTSKKIQFHIFPDANGLLLDYVRDQINQILPNAAVYPTVDYPQYMKLLSICDLRMGTWPFGGSNTTIDCVSLGIPFVTLDGPEVFSHVDSVFIERLCPDLTSQLVASDVNDYVKKTLYLIENDKARNEVANKFRTIDLKSTVFEESDSEETGVSANTLLWAYAKIESILASDKQVIEAEK